MASVIEKIASKSAELPLELQKEVLDFVDSVSAKGGKANGDRSNFKSLRGILKRDLSTLEHDLTEVRREMWGGFPREDDE